MEQNKTQSKVDSHQNNDSNPMPTTTTSSCTNSTNDNPRQDGIDIRKAMSILSSRPQNEHTHIDNNLKGMGQTINLVDESSEESPPTSPSNPTSTYTSNTNTTQTPNESEEDHGTDESEKTKSSDELLKDQLSKQTPSESLQTLFQLQKERVETYRKFNLGLDQVLSSGNLSNYTHFTAEITATFSVISKSIRHVEQSFQSKSNDTTTTITTSSSSSNDEGTTKTCKDISKWIRELQSKEREKLNLTAALHLEKIREKNEHMNLELNDANSHSNTDGNSGSTSTTSIANLLRQGVVSLEKKIGECIEGINEVMEELRYCAADIS